MLMNTLVMQYAGEISSSELKPRFRIQSKYHPLEYRVDMKIKLTLEAFSDLAEIFGKKVGQTIWEREIEEGMTVRKLFESLANEHTKFKEAVFNPVTHELTGNSTVIINNHFLDYSKGLDTIIVNGDTIVFIPLIRDG